MWMTAQGNEDKVSKAKDMITQAIIGLAITLGAYAITAFVTGKLSNSSSGIEPSNNTPVNAPAQTNDLVGSMKPCNAQGEGEKNGWCINKSKSKDVPLNCSTVSIPGSGQCDADEDCCL